MNATTPRVLVLCAHGSEEIETITPCDVLVRAGCDVTLACLDGHEAHGSRGIPLRGHACAIDLLGERFDALVLPGGGAGAHALGASEVAQRLVRDHLARVRAQGSGDGDDDDAPPRVLAAICASPAAVLAPLGACDRKRVTGYPGWEHAFPDSAVYIDDQEVVRDGWLITSRGPGTAMAFSVEIARALLGDAVADRVARELLMPADARAPGGA